MLLKKNQKSGFKTEEEFKRVGDGFRGRIHPSRMERYAEMNHLLVSLLNQNYWKDLFRPSLKQRKKFKVVANTKSMVAENIGSRLQDIIYDYPVE